MRFSAGFCQDVIFKLTDLKSHFTVDKLDIIKIKDQIY